MTQVTLEDKISIPTQRTITDSGQMIVPCAFARVGSQKYTAGSLQIPNMEDNTIIEVHREESEVFDTKSINSFRSVPVTVGHPKSIGGNPAVHSGNSKELQVGMLEGLPVRDEDLLTGTLVISDQEAIELVEGGLVELSAGYTCNIELRDGKYYQTDIKANHIAIVDKGRAGSVCSIADEDFIEEDNMTKKKVEDTETTTKEVEVTDAEIIISLKDEVEVLKASVDSANEKVAQVLADKDEEVKGMVTLISVAKGLFDAIDFEGKTSKEIKLAVLKEVKDTDYSDKSSAYIDARFDILKEDSKGETPMSKMLQDSILTADSNVPVYVDAAKVARDNMIKLQK